MSPQPNLTTFTITQAHRRGQRLMSVSQCPGCLSHETYRTGQNRGIVSFQCVDCGTHFNELRVIIEATNGNPPASGKLARG